MKSLRPFLFSVSAGLALVILGALPVFAEEAAQNPADTSTGVIFRWLNFAIIFLTIAYFAKKGGSFFRSNAKAIAADITEATTAKDAAQRELNEVDAKISHLNAEVAEMQEAGKMNWAVEAERLRTSGVAEIEKIKQSARAELAASERAAQQQLREVAAALAVERAGALVRSRLNVEARTKLFRKFLDELGRSAN